MKSFVHHDALSRRSFLQIGGAALAVPFLGSLARDAHAATQPIKRAVFIVFEHGMYQPFWYPQNIAMNDVQTGVRSGALKGADLGLYFDGLVDDVSSKMSILRGIGLLGAWGHPSTTALTACGTQDAFKDGQPHVPTTPNSVDNVLGASTTIYPSLRSDQVGVLRLAMGSSPAYSHSYANFKKQPTFDTISAAYARAFPNGVVPVGSATDATSGPSPALLRARKRKLSVDKALSRYERLRASGKLSREDDQRLAQTMEYYYQLESGLQAEIAGGGVVGNPDLCKPFEPSDDSGVKIDMQIQLITQAFACGVTNVVYWHMPTSHADKDGAHSANSTANQAKDGLYTSRVRRAIDATAKLMRALDDRVDTNGKTMLDNSLITVTSELSSSVYGSDGHTGLEAPFMLAGGLNGAFRMGEFIDYSDYTYGKLFSGAGNTLYGGPPHNELLIGIMRGFGIPDGEWQYGGAPGYGSYTCDRATVCTNLTRNAAQPTYTDYYTHYVQRVAEGSELTYLRT